MVKFIILTTAIIRPDLHNISIKKFYDEYYLKDKEFVESNFEIYHIINIDAPEKLKATFTQEQTINNFNQIIPEKVNKIYIPTTDPAFLKAYKNIMHKINELNLLDDKNIYWWFEDDWLLEKPDFPFFRTILNYTKFNTSAITMTRNCQLGSFRGGPIMNGVYFKNYFNIENLKKMNDTCDPERQVCNYISAKGQIIFTRKNKIVRELINEYEKTIKLVLVYYDTNINKITPDFGLNYYKEKFNAEFIFEQYIVLINNYDYNNMKYLKYKESMSINDINSYSTITFDKLYNDINSKSITYFIIKPYNFEDCGRDYASKHDLIKGWCKMGDKTTYS